MYGVHPGGRPGPRNNYGPGPAYQRDAAYSNIFGGQAPGRSQTMGTPQMHMQQELMQQVSSPPPGAGQRPPAPMRPPRDAYSPMTNGYHPNQRQPNSLVQQQPQPQYLPQPLNPERRPYGPPQRIETRQQAPANYQAYNRPIPNRGPPPPGPALNSDPYRSRSMATMPSTGYVSPPGNYGPAPGSNNFRQPPQYQAGGSRTTAQGRAIPERHDERAMSMTSWAGRPDHNQTMSGRVIPNRQRESGTDAATNGAYQPNGTYAVPGHTQTMSSTISTSSTAPTISGPFGSRSMSMASTVTPERADSLQHRNDTLQHRPSTNKNAAEKAAPAAGNARAPLVYPALLSRVADSFLDRIHASEREKHNLTYQLAFTGKEAVDLIAYIIKTNDRNLALLLGRALDAQKFFHDVTYEHRLRDSPQELYQFRETVIEDQTTGVNGVFTLLTECYSPTCTRDHLCYSIACPRRLEQQSRLNMRPQPGLRRQASAASLHADDNEEQKLWINTVSKEVADSVGDKEKKRQEVISEIMYTERDFVKDIEYLRDFWIRPLRSNQHGSPAYLPEQKREYFVRTVFGNIMDVHAVNARFAEALTRRQQENPVVHRVGDIFLQFIPRFQPFIEYGSRQLFGKWEFERERTRNAIFSRFVDETERMKESRKLELNGYLTKPTTRLARYPLLLDNVLKNTAEGNPDTKDIPEAIKQIKEFLNRVNLESGKSENRFALIQLHQNLKFPPEYMMDLKLTDETRKIVTKQALKKSPGDSSEIMVYVFDHAVLFAKQKTSNKKDELRVYRRPIPLELLVISQMDEVIPKQGIGKRPSSSLTLTSLGARAALNAPKPATGGKEGYPITFKYLGKPQYELTLYAMNQMVRQKLMEAIDAEQTRVRDRVNVYQKAILCNDFFSSTNRVNCLVPIDGGRKLVYGTDNGIYVSDRRPKTAPDQQKPKKVLEANAVTQVEVLEEYQLLLVLSNKTLVSYPLEALDTNNPSPLSKRPKKIQNHSNFFRAGVCVGRHLVCTAKTSGLSTTIKVFEPMDTMANRARGPGLSNLFRSNQDALKPFKVCTSLLIILVLTIRRSFTFRLSQPQSISSKRSSASLAHVASRLSVSRRWRRSHCWIKPTRLWISWHARRRRGRCISSDSTANSCSTTPNSPSSSTATAGGHDRSGSFIGKAHHSRSRCHIHSSLPSSPASLRFGM
jgi:RHO1 GDP-GTP exchange protein 1/2